MTSLLAQKLAKLDKADNNRINAVQSEIETAVKPAFERAMMDALGYDTFYSKPVMADVNHMYSMILNDPHMTVEKAQWALNNFMNNYTGKVG